LQIIGRGGRRLDAPLEPGDLLVRRLEGRRTHVGVVSDAALVSAEAASGLGIPAERRGRSKLVTVLEPGPGGAVERARVALLEGDVVPFDQLVLRPRPLRRSPTGAPGRAEDERDAERALAAYPASNLAWQGAPAGGLEFMRAIYLRHVRSSAARGSFV